MPLYEFRCETCGLFDQWRTLSEATAPMVCPTCQSTAKRIYSVPGVITTPYALRRRVEQSAEPKVVARPQGEESGSSHDHSHKHSAQGHNHHGRPWMVGH